MKKHAFKNNCHCNERRVISLSCEVGEEQFQREFMSVRNCGEVKTAVHKTNLSAILKLTPFVKNSSSPANTGEGYIRQFLAAFTLKCHSELVSESQKQEMLKQVQHDRQRKTAFTLAEVLITLTIIGVIAALTIPNLMQNYKKHERITAIKTAYSLIQNAVKMSITQNGPTSSWDYSIYNIWANDNGVNFATQYIFPYLKTQRVCHYRDSSTVKAINPTCFINSHSFYDLRKETLNYVINSAVLSNGMHLGIRPDTSNEKIIFIVDVNGKKGPTQAGNDIFLFQMNIADGQVRTYLNNGISNNLNSIMTSTWYEACNTKLSEHQEGLSCARAIELNHWEFPENYPIKKW